MSRIMKAGFAVAGAVFALASVPRAEAQVCSPLSLKGSFGYTVTGTIVNTVGPLTPGPFAAVGKITFDGSSGVTTVRSFSDNGYVLRNDPGTGTYTLNSDCTGSFTITVGPPGKTINLALDIVLDDRDELRGVVTTSGVVLTLAGRKQNLFYF